MKSGGHRVITHYMKNGRITRTKPKGCYNPSKGTKIKVKGQADARVRICHPESKTQKTKGGRKSVKVKPYKYQKKVDTKRARKTPGTSKKTVKVSGHRRKK